MGVPRATRGTGGVSFGLQETKEPAPMALVLLFSVALLAAGGYTFFNTGRPVFISTTV
jgi:hypothetical protein